MRIRILDKDTLLTGGLVDSWTDVAVDADYPPAAAITDGSVTGVFLVSNMIDGSCDLVLWHLTPDRGAEGLSSRRLPASGSCGVAGLPPEPGGLMVTGVRPQSFFLSPPALREGHLWGAYTVAAEGAPDERAVVRWFEVDMGGSLAEAHFVQDARLNDGSWSFLPSVAVDPTGNVALVYERSGPDEFGSAYYAVRHRHDPVDTLRAATPLALGEAPWGHDRFGYYLGASVDPVDGSIWLNGTYVHSVQLWGSRIARLDLSRLQPRAVDLLPPRPSAPAPAPPLGETTSEGRTPIEANTLSRGFWVMAVTNAIVLLLFAWTFLVRAGVLRIGFPGDRFVGRAT